MRFATLRLEGETRAAVLDGDRAGLFDQPDVGELLASGGIERPPRSWVALANIELAPLVPNPHAIVCLGLNYATHIREMGREPPEHPTLFAKFTDALIGPSDPIVLPSVSAQMDWEAELAIVIGTRVHKADAHAARGAIGGFTALNDITARDWQRRTTQWLQGKTFMSTTPVGPMLVTADEVGPTPDLQLRCWVGDRLVQDARTSDLVFDPVEIVSYVSQIVPLRPGDLIATGTPGGVGAAHDPPLFLAPGDVVRTSIEAIGELVNTCVAEEP